MGEGEGSRCLWNRRQEGAGPTSPPWRAVMWGMEQIPAAPAPKTKNMLLNQPAAIRHKQAVHSPQKQKIYSSKIKVKEGVIALMATSIAAFGP